ADRASASPPLSAAGFFPSQLKREANKRRQNRPGRFDAHDEIAGDLRYTADAAPLPDGDFQRRQACGRDPHQHFQIPAIGLLLHTKTREYIAPDCSKRRQVSEACAIDEAQEQPTHIRGNDLLWSKAAHLARAANARTEDEDGLPGYNRRYQIRDELRWIAAIAIEEHQNLGVIARGGNARLDGATVAAARLDDHASPGSLCPLSRAVARAAVDDDDLVHLLRQHRGHDLADRRFLVEARNDCRNDGARRRSLATDLVGHLAHRLQRRPQLAQHSGGLSDNRAARKSR